MSSFEAKTNQAAKALKGRMGLPETEVANGSPYRSEPPAGSYAAAAREMQMREAQQRQTERLEQREELSRIPVNPLNRGEPAQIPQDAVADDGGGSPDDGPPEMDPRLSARAKARIEELARQKNEFERQSRDASAERQRLSKQNEDLNARFNKLQEEFHAMLQANLDHLDPEARTRVMTEASARQAAAAAQEQIMQRMQPVLEQIQQNQFQMELTRLAERYPSFDYDVHADKIAATVRANPNLTPEQAFRAISSDEELGPRVQRSVPPVLHPRGSRGTEHVAPPPPKDPDLDLVEERNKWREMARSGDPAAKKEADRMLQQHLKNRLGLK